MRKLRIHRAQNVKRVVDTASDRIRLRLTEKWG